MLAHARFLLTRMGGGYSAAMAVVFLLALGVRLAYVGCVPPRMTPDSADYLTLAENLAKHCTFSLSTQEPFVPTIRRVPGYPIFLVLAGGAPRAVQSVLDALTAAMICAIAARLGRLRWAVAAALVWAAHPGAIVYADSILSESLFTFLLTGAVALLAARWPAAAGVVMGLAALTRPLGAALAVPIAAVLLFSAIPRRRAAAALFCASMLAVVGPWIVPYDAETYFEPARRPHWRSPQPVRHTGRSATNPHGHRWTSGLPPPGTPMPNSAFSFTGGSTPYHPLPRSTPKARRCTRSGTGTR